VTWTSPPELYTVSGVAHLVVFVLCLLLGTVCPTGSEVFHPFIQIYPARLSSHRFELLGLLNDVQEHPSQHPSLPIVPGSRSLPNVSILHHDESQTEHLPSPLIFVPHLLF
jgi:hypothetical protein